MQFKCCLVLNERNLVVILGAASNAFKQQEGHDFGELAYSAAIVVIMLLFFNASIAFYECKLCSSGFGLVVFVFVFVFVAIVIVVEFVVAM